MIRLWGKYIWTWTRIRKQENNEVDTRVCPTGRHIQGHRVLELEMPDIVFKRVTLLLLRRGRGGRGQPSAQEVEIDFDKADGGGDVRVGDVVVVPGVSGVDEGPGPRFPVKAGLELIKHLKSTIREERRRGGG